MLVYRCRAPGAICSLPWEGHLPRLTVRSAPHRKSQTNGLVPILPPPLDTSAASPIVTPTRVGNDHSGTQHHSSSPVASYPLSYNGLRDR